MNLFELVREKVFWTLDSMHGGLVKNRLKEIEDVFYNGISEACVKQKMEKLFFEAAENTGFYAAYKGCRNLQDFPVVNKIIYKENYDAFVSKKYKDAKDNRFTYTSGSTGIPFTMIQNKEKYGGGGYFL